MRKLVMVIIGLGLGLILISQNANADADIVLLDDNFNSENGGNPYQPNYPNFQNWDVVSGGVDLCGPEYYSYHGMPSWVGLYVDLDGGTTEGGILKSKTNFALLHGKYELKFGIKGSNNLDPSDTDIVVVSLGSVYNETFTLPYNYPFTTITRNINIPSSTTGYLIFDHSSGNDWMGPLLDNIKLTQTTAVPEPSLMVLLGISMMSIVGLRRWWKE